MKISKKARIKLRSAAIALGLAILVGSAYWRAAEGNAYEWLVLSGPETFMPADCVGLKLGLYTYFGEVSLPKADIPVTLTDESATAGSFYSDPSCLKPVS